MIQFRDPPRLTEIADTPRELRAWLTSARSFEPSMVALQQTLEVFERSAALAHPASLQPGAAPQFAPNAAAVGSTSVATKAIAAALIGLSVCGAGLYGWHSVAHQARHPDPTHPLASAVRIMQPQADAPASGVLLPAVTPSAQPPVPSKTLVAPLANGREQRPSASTAGRAAKRSSKLQSAAAPPEGTQPESTVRSVDREQEWRILRAARSLVTLDPSQALALIEEHARKYPRGMLNQEREAIAIEALARLGRSSEARTRAASFSQSFPVSPYRHRNDAAISRSATRESDTEPNALGTPLKESGED